MMELLFWICAVLATMFIVLGIAYAIKGDQDRNMSFGLGLVCAFVALVLHLSQGIVKGIENAHRPPSVERCR